MNNQNLNMIFKNYIVQFERINELEGANENYKWYAVHNFQEVFDIDAPDFAAMLKKACRVTVNMIDNHMQPFSGLVAMAEKRAKQKISGRCFNCSMLMTVVI